MNRQEAKRLAETLTAEQVEETLLAAQHGIKDWKAPTTLNQGLSYGYAYNLYSKIDFSKLGTGRIVQYNFLVIFGDFLPGYQKPFKAVTAGDRYVHHEEPNFKNTNTP